MCWRKGCLDIEDRRTVYYFDRLDVNGLFFFFFFFQAEDGIRDGRVTWSSDVCSSDLVHRCDLGCGWSAANSRIEDRHPEARQYQTVDCFEEHARSVVSQPRWKRRN